MLVCGLKHNVATTSPENSRPITARHGWRCCCHTSGQASIGTRHPPIQNRHDPQAQHPRSTRRRQACLSVTPAVVKRAIALVIEQLNKAPMSSTFACSTPWLPVPPPTPTMCNSPPICHRQIVQIRTPPRDHRRQQRKHHRRNHKTPRRFPPPPQQSAMAASPATST